MKIVGVEIYELTIPFVDGGSGFGLTSGRWDKFETLLIKLISDDGLVGWGECFSYECRSAVLASARDMVTPLILGKMIDDSCGIMNDVQRKLDRFGRYGITMFAISGFDIALWDLLSKKRNICLAECIGYKKRSSVPAYASLVRYGDANLVEKYAAEAVAKGYESVKLHEIDADAIVAGRRGVGENIHLTVDVNCAFDIEQTKNILPLLSQLNIDWLEEPIFPPEDVKNLAKLSKISPIKIAGGENWCTRYQFEEMISNGSVKIPQPSITKVGGISEYAEVLKAAKIAGLTCMPHSPYFGPGYFATLQMLASVNDGSMLEYLYVEPDAFPGMDTPQPQEGKVLIPNCKGIGFIPDDLVFKKYGNRVFSAIW